MSENATSQTIEITVGKTGWRFDPEEVEANVGDILSFVFYPPDHSVVRSVYEHPCLPYKDFATNDQNGQIFSPTYWVSMDNMTNLDPYQVTVTNSEPWFLYCGAPNSCNEKGMVMAINPNKTQTLADYRKRALLQPYSLVPGQDPPSENDDHSTSSTSSETPSATNAAAATVTSSSSSESRHGSGSGQGKSTGLIAGLTVGGVIGLAIIILLGFLLYKKQRRPQIPPNHQFDDVPTEYPTKSMSVYTSPRTPQPPVSPIDGSTARNTIVLNVTDEEKDQMLQRLGLSRNSELEHTPRGGTPVQRTVSVHELDARNLQELDLSRNGSVRQDVINVPEEAATGPTYQSYQPYRPAE